MKAQGPIWLGLTDRAVSLRPYPHISDIRQMVTRSAYAQLGLFAAGAWRARCWAWSLVYLAPVMAALFAWGMSQMAGWLAWIDHGGDVPADPALLSPVAVLGAGAAA